MSNKRRRRAGFTPPARKDPVRRPGAGSTDRLPVSTRGRSWWPFLGSLGILSLLLGMIVVFAINRGGFTEPGGVPFDRPFGSATATPSPR